MPHTLASLERFRRPATTMLAGAHSEHCGKGFRQPPILPQRCQHPIHRQRMNPEIGRQHGIRDRRIGGLRGGLEVDSWVHIAFAGMPRLEVPALTRAKKARVFELRIHESFSELKALKKVAMLNACEIDVMKEVQLSPVYYGQALVGRDLPPLSYLLCSPDRETTRRTLSGTRAATATHFGARRPAHAGYAIRPYVHWTLDRARLDFLS